MEEIKRVMLADIADLITKGTTPTTMGYEFIDQGINFLKIECFKEDGAFLQDKVAHISEECNEKLKRSQLKSGDILFSIAGAIGRVAIVNENMLPANTNQALAIIRICNEEVFLPYVKLILTSQGVRKQFEKRKQGVAQVNLSLKDIGEIAIPLPNMEKQVEYAIIFDKISDILNKRSNQLIDLDNLIKSRFVDMFGDPEKNAKKWEESILFNYLKVIGGYAFKSKNFEVEGIPVLRIGNINSWTFKDTNMVFWKYDRSLDRYAIYPGDLVMSLTGTVGKDDYGNVCFISNEYKVYYLNQRNAKLELSDQLSKYYLANILRFPGIKSRLTGISRGVRQANISNNDILNLKLPIPPIDLQNKFAAFVHHVDKLKVEVQKSLSETQMLFDSLMQKYFE